MLTQPKMSSGIKKLLIFVAIFCVLVIAIVIGVAVGVSLASDDDDETAESECITPDVCNSQVLEFIDDSVNPCDDFYQFSCGGWLAANPLNDRDVRGTFYSLSLDNYNYLIEYLSQPIRGSDPVSIRKIKYMYSACKDVDFIQDNIVSYLQNFIADEGGWAGIGITPDNGWRINEDLASNHYIGSSAFFDFGILPDDLNSSQYIIKVRSMPVILL